MGLGSPQITIQINGKTGEVAAAQTRDALTVAVAVDHADVTWLPFSRWLGGKVRGQFSLPRE